MRGKHSTLYGKAHRNVKTLEESGLIDRVILGRSVGKPCGYPDGSIRVRRDVPVGLQVIIYGSRGLTEAVIFCPDRDRVRAMIEQM
jgi:hypothetical protein